MTKFSILKFCSAMLTCVNLQAEFTDMQITQTTASRQEKSQKHVVFLERVVDNDAFIFRLNAAVVAPCKLYGVKFYDASKCITDKKELDKFNKFYQNEISKILPLGRNYYILTTANLGDRWLCVVSDNAQIYNQTLIANNLAAPSANEYKKIKIKNDMLKKSYPEIYGCLTDKKEPKKPAKGENNETKAKPAEQKIAPAQQNKPVNLKELGVEFGKDFGE